MLKAFSVYDQKSASYSQPFFARTAGEGERMFREEAKNTNSFMSKYPEDFTLYATGEFDPDTGRFQSYEQNIHLLNALAALKIADNGNDSLQS